MKKIEFTLFRVYNARASIMTTLTSYLNKMNDLVSKLMYAAMDDIALTWNGAARNPCLWQSYTNLCKKKADQDTVNNALAISVPVKHFLVFMFKKLIEEINITPLENMDSPDVIGDKASIENDECYTKFMFQLAAKYKGLFGPTLSGATDDTKWFQNQIVGGLPGFATKPVVVMVISFEFEVFLKAIAWLLAPYVWYQQVLVKITDVMFIATLAQQPMNQNMIDIMMNCVPEKAPAKPRVAKKKADATAATSANADATAANAAAEQPIAEQPIAEPNAEPIKEDAGLINEDDEELAGLLEDV